MKDLDSLQEQVLDGRIQLAAQLDASSPGDQVRYVSGARAEPITGRPAVLYT